MDTHRLKVRDGEKIFHENGNQKKAGGATFIPDKIDFKIKTVTRDRKGQHIMINESVQEEDIRMINIYVPKYRSISIHKGNTNNY